MNVNRVAGRRPSDAPSQASEHPRGLWPLTASRAERLWDVASEKPWGSHLSRLLSLVNSFPIERFCWVLPRHPGSYRDGPSDVASMTSHLVDSLPPTQQGRLTLSLPCTETCSGSLVPEIDFLWSTKATGWFQGNPK